MAILIDLIVIIFIVLMAVIGRFRGFTSMVVNIFSLIIALILALVLVHPVTSYIKEHTEIDDNMKTKISSSLPLNDTDVGIEPSDKLPTKLQDYIRETSKNAEKSKEEVLDTISTDLTDKILTVCVGFAIFIIVRLLLLILKVISPLIKKLPVIGTIDKTGGLICGILEAIIAIYIVLTVLSITAPLITDLDILEYINNSYLIKYMYNHNILIGIFK